MAARLPPELAPLGPTVMGGTGGSGTRVVARLARKAGTFIGTGLNVSEDQLEVAEYLDRWLNRWIADPEATEGPMREELHGLLRSHLRPLPRASSWGWKEPRSIYLLPFLYAQLPSLRFLHVVRDGRDMAFSDNQNQLRKHGDAVLGEEGPLDPRRSIALWAKVNTAAAAYGEEAMGDAYLRIRFEDLCADPGPVVRAIHAFLGSPEGDAGCRDAVVPPRSIGRWRLQDPELVGELESIAGPALTRFGYLEDPGRMPAHDHPV